MASIQTECESCRGTGLYAGFCEGPGGARVCCTCEGTGCHTIYYKPFKRRIRRKVANGKRLTTVYLDSAIWTKDDPRAERNEISPTEFYRRKEFK